MSDTGNALAEWYEAQKDVLRLSAHELDSSAENAELTVFLQVYATMDGDDDTPIWLARSSEWRHELESITGRTVRIYRFPMPNDFSAAARYISQSAVPIVQMDWRAPLEAV